MASQRTAASSSLFASLGQLGARLVGVAHTRVQLLALEVEEERRHFLTTLVMILLATVCLCFTLALLTTAVVVVYWEAHRLRVLLALAAAYGLLGAGTALWTVSRMRAKSAPFASSLAELRKDGLQLGGDA